VLRDTIQTYSSESTMVAGSCDNDGSESSGENNDLWVYAGDGTNYQLTPWRGTGSDCYYGWHTTTGGTFSKGSCGYSMPSNASLPLKHVLPDKVRFDGDDSNGGGVFFGWEKNKVWVR